MWQILLYISLGILALYFYMARNNGYWKKKGIPYPPPKPFIGSMNFSPFKNKPLHIWETENYLKYGRLYGLFQGSDPTLTVAIPDLIRDITVKDFNVFPLRRNFEIADEITKNMVSVLGVERWKTVRSAMTPAFSSGKMRKMAHLINECAETTCSNLKEATLGKKPVDLKKIFGGFTMDVIATTAFGKKLDSHNDPNNPFVKHAQKVFAADFSVALILMFALKPLARLIQPSIFPKDTIAFFREITERIIQERKKNPEVKHYDFLQILLDEATEVMDPSATENNGGAPNSDMLRPREGLSKAEILSQCVLFFIAGYETTASTLAFASYNLALNPDCQERLAEEVRKVLKENDNVIDYDTVKKMKYLDAVISETLRLFPPVTRTEREAVRDYILGDTGLTVPKGMVVGFPIYCLHYDVEYFSEPEKFNPDRFLPENISAIKPFTYMPFGAGPRACLAERFALLEIKQLLARMIVQYKFLRARETKVPPKFYTNQGLMVPHDVILRVEKRI